MEAKFYYYKDIADRMIAEMKENGTMDEDWSMRLCCVIANMGQILIELMGASKEKRGIVSPREIVREQARKYDFIDMNVWNEFYRMRNQLVHYHASDIPTDSLIEIILPEFVKEFELLK